ncbi:MAG: YbdD/YjiX family protein [Rickettsiales bacterium]|nr:YbdD/YjiX family protein [Rickettsiales bacterium]
MRTKIHQLLILLRLWLAELNGDAPYARYLAHHKAHHPETAPLSRAAWFRAEQERQWQQIRRCC